MKKGSYFLAILTYLLFFHSLCSGQSTVAKDSVVQKNIFGIANEKVQIEDFPLVFRRTTLIVRDIEKSLALYRDAIGMEIIYDQLLPRPHPTENRQQMLRLVFLKATHSFYGVLGLLEYDYENPDKAEKPIRREGFTAQNVVLLFNSVHQEAQFEKIKKIEGIEILGSPTLIAYPSYDGKRTTRVMVSKFYDPDGFIVEFNKVLDKL